MSEQISEQQKKKPFYLKAAGFAGKKHGESVKAKKGFEAFRERRRIEGEKKELRKLEKANVEVAKYNAIAAREEAKTRQYEAIQAARNRARTAKGKRPRSRAYRTGAGVIGLFETLAGEPPKKRKSTKKGRGKSRKTRTVKLTEKQYQAYLRLKKDLAR